jgi:hypothetical protein
LGWQPAAKSHFFADGRLTIVTPGTPFSSFEMPEFGQDTPKMDAL